MKQFFTEADLEALANATAAAEGRTSGEIVPYIVERVDDHPEARWEASTYGALISALIAGALHYFGEFWGGFGLLWITVPAMIGASAGYLIGGLDPVARFLVGDEALERRVRLRAEVAFLEEEVWKTQRRTGILIFLALWERRAVILGDEGIHRAVPKGTWDDLVEQLVAGIHAGQARETLEEVLGRCGELLERHGLEIEPDDENELPDAPRLRKR